MFYEISNEDLKVIISSKGAEPVSVLYKGKERLWQNENGTWERHAPILFPHAGACSIVVDGKHYIDEFHGFARNLEFDLVEQKISKITLVLKSFYETKKTYPYDFELYVTFEIVRNEMKISYRFVNPTDEDIYFFVGCHESYKVDQDISNYYVEFEKIEKFDSLNLKTEEYEHICEGRYLDLASPLLFNSETIILHNINSRFVSLKRKIDDAEIASTSFEDFPNLLLWHSKDSQMICIEPWMNLPDLKDDKEKELKEKENVVKLSAKQERTMNRTIYYYDNK